MAKRPTIKDVARAAGVSTATVDRALNGRTTVRAETLQRIADAARSVGYHGRTLIDHRLDANLPELRLGVILLKEKQSFYQAFRQELERAVSDRRDIRGTLDLRFAQSQSPEEFSDLLSDLGRRADVVAAIAVNHLSLDRVVQDLKTAGVPTFSLLNDFAQGIRRNYIGLNNMKVGRNAAWMLTQVARPGKVAIFVGGNRWHGHDLREVGFRAYTRENAPGFSVLESLVNLETRQLTYEATLNLLDRHPDLRGIYVAGGGMEGAIAALRETRPPGKVSLIVNEVTPESRAALLDGYVLMIMETPIRKVCETLVDQALRAQAAPDASVTEQLFLDPRIVLPELL